MADIFTAPNEAIYLFVTSTEGGAYHIRRRKALLCELDDNGVVLPLPAGLLLGWHGTIERSGTEYIVTDSLQLRAEPATTETHRSLGSAVRDLSLPFEDENTVEMAGLDYDEERSIDEMLRSREESLRGMGIVSRVHIIGSKHFGIDAVKAVVPAAA
jgi:hypothetical protein